ncbi:hypothetical protein P152DRAFT_140002 [Eremomyces bilateralis CBS 781.70]|uniref:Uncharacterized protein n=1 Tax=Eremomyces bilateralis CBS 781.70 TaxID=1392243 RepID=A0A6G1FWJ9_9PEZI|nr:uncharacterized protein P152DRAFT_140002 [Eremomyces bilateralis CBS 781.70]KAF1810108.1 hypothetical protein P152DRAFT_140002 [Eremomyces bilateralis CBS 781.70]
MSRTHEVITFYHDHSAKPRASSSHGNTTFAGQCNQSRASKCSRLAQPTKLHAMNGIDNVTPATNNMSLRKTKTSPPRPIPNPMP